MFGLGLGAGLKALTAARLAIQTAGQNVANANNPYYSRQRVMLESALPFTIGRGFQIGTGVEVSDVERIVDDGLERRLRLQIGLTGGAMVEHGRLAEIEGIFDEPAGGLSTLLGDLFGKVSRLQTNPADRGLRGGVAQGGRAVADAMNLLSRRLTEMSSSTFDQVRGLVVEVNRETAAIAELNAQIIAAEAIGPTANDLRDTREQHVKRISELLDTQALERKNGSLDLLAGGHLLVSGGRATALSVLRTGTGTTEIRLGASTQTLQPSAGRLHALLAGGNGQTPALLQDLDRLARNLALEWNRLHTTGVPAGGPHSALTAFYGAKDGDGDGTRGDELLYQAGFPFTITKGELYVTVTNKATGDLERTRVAIDPQAMSVQDLAAALAAIDHLDATVEPTGKLRITAETGFGFDFGARLDTAPDTFGSFGGASPSFGSNVAGPFNLTVPAAFTVTVDGTPRAVSLAANEFNNPAAATVDELVTAINTDLGNAATAKNVGGRLVIRSNSTGPAATLLLTDGAGAPLAAMQMTVATAATGQAAPVDVEIAGSYKGSTNGRLIFVPDGDGGIGVTPGLTIGVFDDSGRRVTTLKVGRGDYSPGDYLEVADGVKVKFGPGLVSGTAKQVFAVDTLADSDTTDVLVALGLNSFFHGSTAGDLALNPDLEQNPDLFAASLTGASGDAGNLSRLLSLRTTRLAELADSSFEDFYSDLVGNLGFETAAAEATLQAQDQLLATLQRQRESISGVDIDEEMIDLVRHQQAFEAASRFLNVISEMAQTLIQLGAR
jgi:flagellar hook-associated protein FlgK